MKTVNWNQLDAKSQAAILSRPRTQQSAILAADTEVIIEAVKREGDQALLCYTERFDKVKLDKLRVSEAQLQNAQQRISPNARAAITHACERIQSYHEQQLTQSILHDTQDGIVCERQSRPIERVGLYVPGGSAPLISTLMMLAIPAQIAKCPRRVLCTPPQRDGTVDPHLLFAAHHCGIHEVYAVGGAQSIAAMAYGTESVPKVDKIFGPGNAFVTMAKLLVSKDPDGASIDMPAGPSELMVIADQNANPAYVAADLLSQAEHGVDSQVMLVSDSQPLITHVLEALSEQVKQLSRKAIAEQALANSVAILVDDIHQAIAISNRYAPEHLSLQLESSDQYKDKITCAGAVFLGAYTPETMGDYVNGSNHVLPTYGYARSFSGLSVNDFMTFISFQKVSPQGLSQSGPLAMVLAELEGLGAHYNAVNIRLNDLKEKLV